MSYASVVKRKYRNESETSLLVDKQTSSSPPKISSDSKIDIPAARNNVNQVESLFPSNISTSPTVNKIIADLRSETMEKLKLIKPSSRTKEQQNQLRQIKNSLKMDSLTDEEKESIRNKN